MKTFLKGLAAASLLAFGAAWAIAAQTCQRSDLFCYETGPSGVLATPARLDASGNLTVGNATVVNETASGTTVYPSANVSISTFTSLSPTASYLLLVTTGIANITLTSDTFNGAPLSTTTATNGQFVTLGSTTSVTTVTLTTGTASGIIGDDFNIVITSTKSAISFIFNNALKQWFEVGKQ